MFRLNHRSIKVTLFSEIHIKIISKISLTYHQIAFYLCNAVMLLFFVYLQLLCHSSGQHIDQKYDHKKYKRNAKCYIILGFCH